MDACATRHRPCSGVRTLVRHRVGVVLRGSSWLRAQPVSCLRCTRHLQAELEPRERLAYGAEPNTFLKNAFQLPAMPCCAAVREIEPAQTMACKRFSSLSLSW